MPITVNSPSSSSVGAVSTTTFAHNCGTKFNRLIIVAISDNAAGTVTSVTYGGVNMTLVRSDTNSFRTSIYQLTNPLANSNNVVVNWSASIAAEVSAISFNGVDVTTPIEANVGTTGSSTTMTNSITTLSPEALVLDVGGSSSPFAWTPNGTQTSVVNTNGTTQDLMVSTKFASTPGSSTTMAWTNSFSTPWTQGIISIIPSRGASFRPPTIRPHLFSPGTAR